MIMRTINSLRSGTEVERNRGKRADLIVVPFERLCRRSDPGGADPFVPEAFKDTCPRVAEVAT
jgi:hypothetical protein